MDRSDEFATEEKKLKHETHKHGRRSVVNLKMTDVNILYHDDVVLKYRLNLLPIEWFNSFVNFCHVLSWEIHFDNPDETSLTIITNQFYNGKNDLSAWLAMMGEASKAGEKK